MKKIFSILVLGLLLSGNVYAGNFSVECKRGDLKYETWGHRNNDIWFIKEDEKDVCRIYRDKNKKKRGICYNYVAEEFKGDQIIFYWWNKLDKYVLDRTSAELVYYTKDDKSFLSSIIAKWKKSAWYKCRKVSIYPDYFYTKEEFKRDLELEIYNRNKRKF